jgi:hypothetical protein
MLVLPLILDAELKYRPKPAAWRAAIAPPLKGDDARR